MIELLLALALGQAPEPRFERQLVPPLSAEAQARGLVYTLAPGEMVDPETAEISIWYEVVTRESYLTLVKGHVLEISAILAAPRWPHCTTKRFGFTLHALN